MLTREHIAAMADMGVNRASLGVQDFELRVQEAIGRRQSFGQTARAADGLREAGIVHINLDLMYGLPHQTVATVTDTAERALALRPDRIALFGYAHVPWMKRHQKLIPEVLPLAFCASGNAMTRGSLMVPPGFDCMDHCWRPKTWHSEDAMQVFYFSQRNV
jgi:oxygen-independent coproporphyrinogen-3 oxidase